MMRKYKDSRNAGLLMWIVQGLLALIFLLAGGMKLVLPLQALTEQSSLPGLFLRFIGVCEVLGALGLILPGLLHIQEVLTPLAAAGLVVIMIGATVIAASGANAAAAIVPLTFGLLLASLAYGRWQPAPRRRSARQPGLQLAS